MKNCEMTFHAFFMHSAGEKIFQTEEDESSVLIILQGLPAANTSEGMSFVTTLPAPITVRSPILTPGQITALPPIQTSSPMAMGLADSRPVARSRKSTGCVTV